jgi:glycine C-acetyltransferase
MMQLPPTLQQVDRTYVLIKGRKLSYFAGCDYFRLASHPQVLKAVETGLRKYGLNVSASRMTTGNHKLYGKLEERLAEFYGVEAALLASNGYAPNLMVAQALSGQHTHALLDERAHGCLVDAAYLLDCPVIRYKHRDVNDLEQILRRLGNVKPIILTDGMFSHDGSIAPLGEILKLLSGRGMILLDDAHGAGVLGKKGRGTPEHLGVPRKQIIQTITLSKAFGNYGGAVLGARPIVRTIIGKSRLFIGNTPLPLPLASGGIAAVGLLKKDASFRIRLNANSAKVKEPLLKKGLTVGSLSSPILPVIPKTTVQAESLKKRLLAAGIYPSFIKYPGGPESGYFRFVISSEHTTKQLANLLEVLLSSLT